MTESTRTDAKDDFDFPQWASTLGGLVAWGAFLGKQKSKNNPSHFSLYLAYAFVLSPNQTPSRDIYFLEKFLNVAPDDGFHINTVFYCIFYLFGLTPLVYASLMIPAARSKNKVSLAFQVKDFRL